MNTVTAQPDRKQFNEDQTAHNHSQSTRAGRRFGRSAWILHGLAYVFFLSAWGVMLLLGETTAEAQPVQGVGGAAAIVLSLWSLVLSIRALIAAERPLLPVLNIALVMVEITAPCVAVWWPLLINYRASSPLFDLAITWGLPVFVPFLSLGGGIAVYFAWLWTAKAERRREKLSKEEWSRHQRWRFGVLRFAAVLALLAMLILPAPLYIFSALSTVDSGNGFLQRTVLEVTPAFLKTGVYRFLSNGPSGVRLKYGLLHYGAMPDQFLLEMVNNKKEPMGDVAFEAVWTRNSQDGARLAWEISKAPKNYSPQIQNRAGLLMAIYGSTEEVEALLPAPGAPMDPLRSGVYYGLCSPIRKDMIPVLVPLLNQNDLVLRRFAAHVIASVTNTTLSNTPSPGSTPETPQELGELKVVRAAAKKALQP